MSPIPLQVRPSRVAAQSLFFVTLAAVGVALLLPLGWCVATILGLLVYGIWLRRSPIGPVGMQVLVDGRLTLVWPDGRSQQADLLASSLITAVVMVLHLRTDSGRIYLMLWPDSADRDVLRQWRVWLLWDLPALKRRLLMMEDEQS